MIKRTLARTVVGGIAVVSAVAIGAIMAGRQSDAPPKGWPATLTVEATGIQRAAPAVPAGRIALAMPLPTSDGSVEPSPASGVRLLLPAGTRVVAVAVSRLAPRLAAVVEGASGQALVDWRVGKEPRLIPIEGTTVAAIAFHPLRDDLFATSNANGGGAVIRVDLTAPGWTAATLWTGSKQLNALAVSTLPYCLSRALIGPGKEGPACTHRIFFAEQGVAGWQVRTVAEDGRAPYLAIGPAPEPFTNPDEALYDAPKPLIAQNLRPLEFGSDGQHLRLVDGDNCLHVASYGVDNWAELERSGECGSPQRVAPNGIDVIDWKPGTSGIRIVPPGNEPFVVAAGTTFVQFSGLTADGSGVFGSVGAGIEFVPIDYPLGDVANAWQFPELLGGRQRGKIAAHGGVFTPTSHDQLFQLYEGERYVAVDEWRRPQIVTSDVFWETASAAFHGTFSEIERRQAMPAFTRFISLAATELGKSHPGRKIVRAIEASKAVLDGRTDSVAAVLLNDPENKPRGLYEKNPAAQRYFVAMRSFAHAKRTSGEVEPLRHLSAEARAAAEEWMAAYRPFIAPPRHPVPYGEAPTGEEDGLGAEYRVFPLSSGFDNLAIRSLIHTEETGGMLSANGEPRMLPSAVDLAAVFGNKTAADVVAESGVTAIFPNLNDRIAALASAWRGQPKRAGLYERWLEAMGEEWREDGLPWLGRVWEAKRLQTGLAAWVSLRHSTILVNEREGAEGGEGGPEFERMQFPEPRGLVEPNPAAFEAVGRLYDKMDAIVESASLPGEIKSGLRARVASAKEDVSIFAAMARKEIEGTPLSDEDNRRIQEIAAIAEHNFLVFLSLANSPSEEEGTGGISTPDPVPKVADVAGRPGEPVLEVAIGNPLLWNVAVPFAGRRQVVFGPVYSFHEFVTEHPMADSEWRGMAASAVRPSWVERHVSSVSTGE